MLLVLVPSRPLLGVSDLRLNGRKRRALVGRGNDVFLFNVISWGPPCLECLHKPARIPGRSARPGIGYREISMKQRLIEHIRTYTPTWARFSAATRSVSLRACLRAREAIWVYLFQLHRRQSCSVTSLSFLQFRVSPRPPFRPFRPEILRSYCKLY